MFHRGGPFRLSPSRSPRFLFTPQPPTPIRESLPELTIPPAGNNLIIIVQWLGRSRQYRAQVALGCHRSTGGVVKYSDLEISDVGRFWKCGQDAGRHCCPRISVLRVAELSMSSSSASIKTGIIYSTCKSFFFFFFHNKEASFKCQTLSGWSRPAWHGKTWRRPCELTSWKRMQKVNPRQARQSVAVRADESSRSLNNLHFRGNIRAKTSVRVNDVFFF